MISQKTKKWNIADLVLVYFLKSGRNQKAEAGSQIPAFETSYVYEFQHSQGYTGKC